MSTITRPTTTARPFRDAGGEAPGYLEIQAVTSDADAAEWAQYAQTHPDATFCHHPDWCAAVERVFGHRARHLLARRGGRVVGILPLMQVDSPLAGRMLVSVPYGTYGGVLSDAENATQLLAQHAAELARDCGAHVLDMRSARADIADFEQVDGYLGFVRDLPDTPTEVGTRLPKRARAAARHARDRDGVTVQHDPALLPIVWRLYCRSMRRIASLNYPLHFFEELQGRFGERAWVSAAFVDGRPVAGTISYIYRDTIMPYILGADERIRCEGAANLLYWQLMERAVEAGLRRWDYGRSRADNHGAVGFKKNQGFEPQSLGYQRYVPPGRSAPDLRPSNPRFAWARRAWCRLPLPVSRWLGCQLARWIPG